MERKGTPLQYLLGGIAMPDKMMPGPVQDAACIREAVCIHTKKIYDSCKEEDIASYNLNPYFCSLVPPS